MVLQPPGITCMLILHFWTMADSTMHVFRRCFRMPYDLFLAFVAMAAQGNVLIQKVLLMPLEKQWIHSCSQRGIKASFLTLISVVWDHQTIQHICVFLEELVRSCTSH